MDSRSQATFGNLEFLDSRDSARDNGRRDGKGICTMDVEPTSVNGSGAD
jgi:hypothetical protein